MIWVRAVCVTTGMKLALLVITLAGLAVLVVVFSTGDTRISESPVEIAETRAARTIEEAGGERSDWELDGECVAMGPCQVALSAAALPGEVLATDRYTVKDSRASVNGPERIGAVVERAVSRECFDRFEGRALRSCLTAEAQIPVRPPGS